MVGVAVVVKRGCFVQKVQNGERRPLTRTAEVEVIEYTE